MKGILALDVVVKWIILSVVALVVISLVIYFSDKIRGFIENKMDKDEEIETQMIESDKFSTSQLATYIRGCWDKTGERFYEDVICYILKGDVSGADIDLLEIALEQPAQVDVSNFMPSKKTTIIRFEDLGNIVYVES